MSVLGAIVLVTALGAAPDPAPDPLAASPNVQFRVLEPKPFPALDSLLAQVFRAAVSLPHAWAGAPQSALRGDEHAVIRIENLADELFGDFWPIGIGGVDEINPELDKAL